MLEKGAVFESIFKTTTTFTKDEFYDLIAYISTLDEIKIKIMEINLDISKSGITEQEILIL